MISSDRASPHIPEIAPDSIEGKPERQVPALEPFLLPFLYPVRVGPVDQLLAQAAQLGRVQARHRFRPGRRRGRIRRGSGSPLGPGEGE